MSAPAVHPLWLWQQLRERYEITPAGRAVLQLEEDQFTDVEPFDLELDDDDDRYQEDYDVCEHGRPFDQVRPHCEPDAFVDGEP